MDDSAAVHAGRGRFASRTLEVSSRPVLPVIAFSLVLAAFVQSPASADLPKTLWEELGCPKATSASGAYDPLRKQMVILLAGSGNVAEVWAYDFSLASPQWEHLLAVPLNTTQTITPSADWGVVYDALRDRFVTTGGVALSGTTPRTWTLLGSGTNGHRNSAVLDPFADRLLNYDGNGVVQTLDLTTPTSWVTLATVGTPPPNRAGYTVTFDTDHRRLIVFGGNTGTATVNDVWSLSLATTPTWTRIFPMYGPPSPRRDHVAIYDSRHRRMIIMGGTDSSPYANYTDAWELSLTPGSEYWSYIAATAPNQEPASSAAAADDSLSDRLLVYPTQTGIESLTLSGDPYLWTRHSPDTLVSGSGPCVYDALRHQLVSLITNSSDPLSVPAMPLEGKVEWEMLATSNTGPALTGGEAMIYDPNGDRLVTFGGNLKGDGYTFRIFTLSLASPRTWGGIFPTGAIIPVRVGASAIYDPVGKRMVMFGGFSTQPGVGATNDAYGISLIGPASWAPLPATNPPPRRTGALAIYDSARQRLVIHGGTNPGVIVYDDTWALPLDGSPLVWSQVQPQGIAPQIYSAPATYDPVRDRMVVIPSPSPPVALSFSGTPTWSAIPTFGVGPGGNFQSAGAFYDPIGDRLVAINNDGNPWSLRFDVPEQLSVEPPTPAPASGATIAPAISALRPNPARGAFTLEYSLPNQAPATAELFDVRGRRVYRDELTGASAGRQQHLIDLPPSLAPGLYFVRISQSGLSATSRIAIVR